MKICNLASGSEGNVTYVETERHKILLDLGMTVKYIKERLSELSVCIEDIDYVFITHVHDDHIKALKSFIKKYNPTICVSPKMFSELEDLKYYEKVMLYDDFVALEDTIVEVLKTSHDTSDSRSFVIRSDGKSMVYMTDTGFINTKHFKKIENLYLPKLNAECILFMLVRLADQVGTPYNASNIDTNNVSSSYPGIYFDHKNIRSSRSVSGLKVTIPPSSIICA